MLRSLARTASHLRRSAALSTCGRAPGGVWALLRLKALPLLSALGSVRGDGVYGLLGGISAAQGCRGRVWLVACLPVRPQGTLWGWVRPPEMSEWAGALRLRGTERQAV